MNEDMFACYSEMCLLEAKQIPIHVDDLPNKPITRDKIEPLGSQRVGPKNRQLGVTWLKHFIMSSEMKKC
jgi:hypothetical protein